METGADAALTQLSATELARRIAQGETTAVAAVEAHIARIEQVNAALNAVVVKRYDAARAEARAADERRATGKPIGALHGVPITIKDSLDLEGTPSTFGLTRLAATTATQDDRYVARLRAAGAIVLGKTNVPQLLFYNETANYLYGRTNNPWDLGRTPGGTSGGEAAIIAAGGSPLGLATDWGGSVRTPAAYCGLVGLKPTTGRTPDAGRYSLPPGQESIICQVGVMARHVDDVALGLATIADRQTPMGAPLPPLGDPASVEVAGLRVAYYTDDGTLGLAPGVRRAVIEAAGMLAGRGATVVEWQPPEVPTALDLFYGILSADGGRSYRELMRGERRDPRLATLLRLTGLPRPALAALGGLLAAAGQRNTSHMVRLFGHRDTYHYWRLVEAQREYQRRFLQALDNDDGGPFDVIICPASALPAFPHGAARDLITAGGYAPLYNLLGYPAGVVPVTRVRPGEESTRRRSLDTMERAARRAEQGSAGLPVGVQVVARPWCEHIALAAMRAIEEGARSSAEYPAQPPLSSR